MVLDAYNKRYCQLANFVQEECCRRLLAYDAQPRDVTEHYETENEVLSGGYAYRQIFELIQNSADAITTSGESKGKIYVKLTSDRLEAANTGAPLDEDGIVALLNARSSSKRGNQIGRFGIGFKSLLKLSGCIDLVSRSIGLRFDPIACRRRIREQLNLPPDSRVPGMRLAEVLNPNESESVLSSASEYSWATTVVSVSIANNSVFGHIAKEMRKFPPEFLLFLHADINLDLDVEGEVTRRISKRVDGDVSIVSDGATEPRWKLFETRVKVKDPEALSDATHIHGREDLPLAWAVPIDGPETAGSFWAFFPTETQSRTSGILNAPWKLNSDRTSLIRGPYNTAIMELASNLIADSLPKLASTEDYGAPVSAFPRILDREDELAAPLVNSLWTRIINSCLLPDADGNFHKPSELNRHPIDDSGVCKQWADLAKPAVRSSFIHPDCYRSKDRISRINRLADEVKHRSTTAFEQCSVGDWLKHLANADMDQAKCVLYFVGKLLEENILKTNCVQDVPLIPVTDGKIVCPSKAVISSNLQAPTGLFAVNDEIVADPKCKKILLDIFKIKEISDESWNKLLDQFLDIAEEKNNSRAWDDFWRKLSDSPKSEFDRFISHLDINRLKYRTLSGSWMKRNCLVVDDSDQGIIKDELLMDLDYIRKLDIDLPNEWLSEFPSMDEIECWKSNDMRSYICQASQAFWAICKEKSGRTPRYRPSIQGDHEIFPGGCRLLEFLPPKPASRLTKLLLEHVISENQKKSIRPVSLAHPTCPNDYPKVSAPHPLWFYLTKHGRVSVGNEIFDLEKIPSNLASILANCEITGFNLIKAFFFCKRPTTRH